LQTFLKSIVIIGITASCSQVTGEHLEDQNSRY